MSYVDSIFDITRKKKVPVCQKHGAIKKEAPNNGHVAIRLVHFLVVIEMQPARQKSPPPQHGCYIRTVHFYVVDAILLDLVVGIA